MDRLGKGKVKEFFKRTLSLQYQNKSSVRSNSPIDDSTPNESNSTIWSENARRSNSLASKHKAVDSDNHYHLGSSHDQFKQRDSPCTSSANTSPQSLYIEKSRPDTAYEVTLKDSNKIIEGPSSTGNSTPTTDDFNPFVEPVAKERSLKRPISNEYFRQYRIGGVPANSSSPEPENHPFDECSLSFATMAVFEDDLQSNIEICSGDLERRLVDSRRHVERTRLSGHLLKDPPKSPASPNISPVSPGYKQLKQFASTLQDRDQEELVRKNEEFESLLNSLNGIQEWWHRNCVEWLEKKKEIARHKDVINAFAEQRDEHYQAMKRIKLDKSEQEHVNYLESQVEHFQEQVEIIEVDHDEKLTWFVHRRKLMREAWKRFRALQEEMFKLEDEAYVREALKPPVHAFEFVLCSGNYDEIPMIRDKGILWWFTHAVEDLAQFQQYLNQEKMKWKEHRQKCMFLEAENRGKASQNLRTYQQSETWFDGKIQGTRTMALAQRQDMTESDEVAALLTERVARRKKFEQSQELLNNIILSFVIQDNLNRYKHNELVERSWRVDSCLRIVASTIVQLERGQTRPGNPGTSFPNPKIIVDIINICYYEYMFHKGIEKLDQIITIDQVSLQPYLTKRMIHEAKNYLERSGIHKRGQKILKMNLPGSLEGRSDTWKPMHDLLSGAIGPFIGMIRNVEALSQQPEPDYKIETTAWKPPQLPAALPFPSWAWTSRVNIDQAFKIMNTRRTPHSHPVGLKIFRFFNSPSIVPLFWGKDKARWTQVDFFKLIRSLLEDDSFGKEEHWLAFLTACNFTGEMFTVSRLLGNIYVSPQGWEIWPEVHVSHALTQRLQFEPPREIEKLERTMLRHKTVFRTESHDRSWHKEDLLKAINGFKPDGELTKKTLDKYLAYWSEQGKFFVNTHLTKTVEIVYRVDNGWEISLQIPWATLATKPHKFDEIARKVERETDIRPACFGHPGPSINAIFTTETDLYNHVYNVKSEETSVDCSRLSFHLYLRWTDQIEGTFQLFRNGDLLVLGKGWGSMGPDAVTRVGEGDGKDFIRIHRRRRIFS